MAHEITQLAADIQRLSVAFDPQNEKLRWSLLQSARDLVHALETPNERIAHMMYSEPYAVAATRTLIDLRLFHILAASKIPVSVDRLACLTGCDPRLLSRLLKHVASEGLIKESQADQYTANDMTRTITSPGGEGAIRDLFNAFQIAGELPAFLKDTGYANPIDKDRTLWKYAKRTDQDYFDYIRSPGREEMMEAFENHMAFKSSERKWFEDEAIMDAVFRKTTLYDSDVLMVDVGGDSGHDLLAFKKAYGHFPGSLILQDLPTVISSLNSPALSMQGVETMPHDMFTPQPVRDAKVYYSKMVLHDWPEEQCKQALAQLRPALKPQWSRILLNEFVVPDENAHWMETGLDMLMMAMHSSQERRAWEWTELVESVEGLRMRKIWDIDGAAEKIIEIESAGYLYEVKLAGGLEMVAD